MSKDINIALALGAEEIHKAAADKKKTAKKADAKKAGGAKKKDKLPIDAQLAIITEPTPEELLGKKWKVSGRNINDILADHVKFADGRAGVILGDNTPLEEGIPILDHFKSFEECAGFYIGDVIIAMQKQHGNKFEAALAITGRAMSTLSAYVRTAKAVPIKMRQEGLSFTAHRQVARMTDETKKVAILKDAGEKAAEGKAPTVKELQHSVTKAEPPTKTRGAVNQRAVKKAAKKAGKPKPVVPTYTYTAEEQAMFDVVLETLSTLDDMLGSKEGKDFLSATLKVDNKIKRQLNAVTHHVCHFARCVEDKTGY